MKKLNNINGINANFIFIPGFFKSLSFKIYEKET
jgi:hypothetical protein